MSEAGSERFVIELASSSSDLDDVAALEAACFTNPWTREMLEREVSRSDFTRIYVVREQTRLVAFCACWLIVDELHVNTIAVHPDRRRSGIATMLMRHVLDESARAGMTRATLEVRASNDPARRLYAGLGFRETSVRPRYYRHPEEDAIILWQDL